MNTDSPELDEARTELDKAVRKFAAIKAQEYGTAPEDCIVLGWAGYLEYTSAALEKEDSTGNIVMVPDFQAGSMTRGLLEFATDAFRR